MASTTKAATGTRKRAGVPSSAVRSSALARPSQSPFFLLPEFKKRYLTRAAMPRTSTRTTSSQTRPIPHIMPPMPSIMSFDCIGLRRLPAELVNCERLSLHARHAGRAHRHARQGDAGDVGPLAGAPVEVVGRGWGGGRVGGCV